MVCIAQVILNDLLQHELICPYHQFFRAVQRDLTGMIPGQHRGSLHHTAQKFRHIELLPGQCHITRFQLVQIQQALHDMIHLFRFINNDIAVEIPAVRIVIRDPVLQPLGIPLNQRNRRLQFMRYI